MNDNDARPQDELTDKRDLAPQPANPTKQPLGDRLRNLIQPALEDSRRHSTQLNMLDKIFDQIALNLESICNRSLGNVFNQAAAVENNNGPEARNLFVIRQLTEVEGLDPLVRLGLPIATGFIEFSPRDITELAGYIKLHEKARELNIALKLINVTMDETKSQGIPPQAILVVDISKSYDDGALENANLYPQLPPVAPAFDRRSGNGFRF